MVTPHYSTLYTHFQRSSGICTDTRKLEAGQLFFALKGESFNGNLYAAQALAAGASLAVVDDASVVSSDKYILVPDVLQALQDLARHHLSVLKQAGLKVLAVCGSNGKTTTKELVSRVLATKYKTFATPGNLNNHIGVPLSILQLTPQHHWAVLELGANAAGEIALLCTMADPDAALITNIGKDHLEGFGTVAGVAAANGEVFDYVKAKGLPLFCNTQEEWVVKLVGQYTPVITYPGVGDTFTYSAEPSDTFLKVGLEDGTVVTTGLVGHYNFANVATALAVGQWAGVPLQEAAEAAASYRPTNMRSQIVETGSNTLILDAYNANPSSMVPALENLASMHWNGLPKAFFIGDMAELGPDSEEEHKAIGRLAASLNIQYKVFVGTRMLAAHAECPGSLHFSTRADAKAWLMNEPLKGHLVLLKGSRSSGMEQLQDAL